ncbi:hypothetical protein M569_06705 [Genlisea aurea]|uniref:Uncharacterized protein n=1 Tax=Genlisea aurea TaxID=192259 RepID=S8CT60_9LAMI|nr:hypothetical protein M569_06705 [Genlisea aurea]
MQLAQPKDFYFISRKEGGAGWGGRSITRRILEKAKDLGHGGPRRAHILHTHHRDFEQLYYITQPVFGQPGILYRIIRISQNA